MHGPRPDPLDPDRIIRAAWPNADRVDGRRENQHPPGGDWLIWLLHPGRGWGKGFTASHWIRDRVERGVARAIALVGSTVGHVRQLMIEHPESGILAVCPDAVYLPGRAEIHWPNGAIAYICSAENADKPPLRGGNFDTAWPDEVDSWGLDTSNRKAMTAWENLTLSVRKGDARMVVTSTPKPGRIVADLLKRAKTDGDVVVTTGSTYENAANLSSAFIPAIERRYKGTRLERQEIYGEVLEEVYGALWTPGSFQYAEVDRDELGRVVVGVDPSGGGDEIGIVADGEYRGGWVCLDDWSLHGSPERWARKTAELYDKWEADLIAAERNYGGDMVESTIRAAGYNLPVKLVPASRGKHVRAEPVALLYEQERVWHRRAPDARLDLLEDELRYFTTQGYEGESSPNRADAHVWAMTELALKKQKRQIRVV